MRPPGALLAVCLVLILAGCAGVADPTATPAQDIEDPTATPTETGTQTPTESAGDADPDGTIDGELEIHHIDVGQADATLLIEPGGETMLVDSGDWRNDGADVLAYLEEHDVDRIDHLVATHAHADHIGGHEAVIDHFEAHGDGIGAAYDSGVAHTSQTYERYLDAIERHDVQLFAVEAGDSFAFGDADVTIYNPPAGDSGSDLHYNSIVMKIEFGSFAYLTTGDAEVDAESRIVDAYGAELESSVYQAGHHGSSTSSTEELLDAATPEVVVISSAFDSQYGHPHEEVLNRFAEHGIETYWTGVHGHVLVTTDGETVWVEPENDEPTDAAALLDMKPTEESESIRLPSSKTHAGPVVG